MENIIKFKNILFGFTGYGDNKRIMAFQDGDYKISANNTVFNAGETVIKFIEHKGNLYAAVRGLSTSRLLKLAKINIQLEDTWEEVIGVSDLDERLCEAISSYDRIYLFGTNTVWYYDTAVNVADVLPAGFTPYSSICIDNDIYLYGKTDNYGTVSQTVYKYNDVDGYDLIYNNDSYIDFDSYYDVYGKTLIVEYNGKVYFPIIDGTHISLKVYEVASNVFNTNYELCDLDNIVTTMLVYDGLILSAVYDTIDLTSNVIVYVPKRMEYENVLIAGDNSIDDIIHRVDSDPICTDRGIADIPLLAADEFPVIANLKGKLNSVIKYGKRFEPYCDLWNIDSVISASLKDLVDQLCTLCGYTFFVDGQNNVKINKREVVGHTNKFAQINHNTDYGDIIIKDIGESKKYPNSYRRITINWSNLKSEDNTPVSVGSLESMGSVFSFDSSFINDPITAYNVAINLLSQLVSVESLSAELSFSHYLEAGDNVSFNVNRDFVYIDKDREYKIYQVEHDLTNKTTKLLLVERILVETCETI